MPITVIQNTHGGAWLIHGAPGLAITQALQYANQKIATGVAKELQRYGYSWSVGYVRDVGWFRTVAVPTHLLAALS